MRTRRSSWPVAALGALLFSGCVAVDFDGIRRDFEAAVAAEFSGQLKAAPFTDPYRAVVSAISDTDFSRLEPEELSEAWMMWVVSLWRSGNLQQAQMVAQDALRGSWLAPGSRERVLTRLVEALSHDELIREAWGVRGSDLALFVERYQSQFGAAANGIQTTISEMDSTTPADVRHYVAYQRWRVIQNWRQVLSGLPGEDSIAAHEESAKAFVPIQGLSDSQILEVLRNEAETSRDSIPSDHPLRELIRADGGG